MNKTEELIRDGVLKELVEIVGNPVASEQDIKAILEAGVPHALKAQMDMILAGSNERTKAFMIQQWLDRALGSPVQRVAVAQRISLDERTLQVLEKVALEDAGDDGIRGAVDAELGGDGLGAGAGDAPAAVPG